MSTLDQLSLAMDPATDKDSRGHDYLNRYAHHFAPYRDRVMRILEIGVWQGVSLELWARYFTKAQIHGADNDLSRCKVANPRVRLWEVNQSVSESLINMARNLGPWTIIIDDGSHLPGDQLTTFKALWPFLMSGGLYCIEDLHVNYKNGYDPLMADYIGTVLQADVHARGKLSFARAENCSLIEQESLDGREREVGAIHVYRHLVIIEKWATA